jgi:hypothetical protein
MRLDIVHRFPTAELAEVRRMNASLERIATALEKIAVGGMSEEEQAQIASDVAKLKASSDRLEAAVAATRPTTP